MRIVGRRASGESPFVIAANTKHVARFYFPEAVRIPKLTLDCDGLAATPGESQPMKAIIYDILGNKVVEGTEVIVEPGADRGWRDLPFATVAGVELPVAGWYDLGVIAGTGSAIRAFGDSLSVNGGKTNADTYSDGAAAVFGSATPLASDLAIFATTFVLPTIPEAEDSYLARLPFSEVQRAFESSAVPRSARRAICGWHGTRTDEETGMFGIVARDGALADYLGERIVVTHRVFARRLSVIVFIHTDAERLPDGNDLSVTRHVFSRLALLGDTSVIVTAELMS